MDKKQIEIKNSTPKKQLGAAKKLDQIVLNPKTVENLKEKVVDLAQRRKRASLMRRIEVKLKRRKQLSAQKLHSTQQISRKSQQIAKGFLRRRMAGARGIAYQHLSAADKMQVDTIVDKKAKLIRSMAMKMIPRLRAADVKRLQAVRSGQAVKGIQKYMSSRPLSQGDDFNMDHLMKMWESVTFKDLDALQKKAEAHEINPMIVEMVFLRGLYEDQTVDKAFNRVNSFLAKGKAYVVELSSDLLARYKQKAGQQASAADKAGDYKKGNKRLSGIIKATTKQFDNDAKKESIEVGDYFDLELDNITIESSVIEVLDDGVVLSFDQTAMDKIASFELSEAEYQGRQVSLNKPTAGDVKKSKVYVKGPSGRVVKVNFGDKNMTIKKNIPARRKSFRARHNCANPGPKHKARYWSCKAW